MRIIWKVSGKRSPYSLSSVRHSTVSERAITLAVLMSVLRRACVYRRGCQIFFLTLSLFRQWWKLCNVVKHPIKWSLMHDMKIIISSLESSPVPNNCVLPCVCVPKNHLLPKIITMIILCSPNEMCASQNVHLFPTYSLVPKIIDNLQSPKVIHSCPKNHLFPKIIDNLLFPKGYTSSPK